MRLTKWEPFDEIENFWRSFPNFGVAHFDNSLAVDVYEKDKNLVAEMNIPGVNPKDIHIEVEDGYLRISGETREEKEEKEKQYYSKEIRRGSFERVVSLPHPVQKDKVKAEYAEGVLTVFLPKAKEAKANKVKIEIKKKKK